MPKVKLTYTDLFGGELNYSWIREHEIELKEDEEITNRKILKIAREQFGITERLTKTHDYGDYLQYKQVGWLRALCVEFRW